METYFSQPNEDNVSDDIMEALMRSVIRNLRVAMDSPEDYTARSNLMWDPPWRKTDSSRWEKVRL